MHLPKILLNHHTIYNNYLNNNEVNKLNKAIIIQGLNCNIHNNIIEGFNNNALYCSIIRNIYDENYFISINFNLIKSSQNNNNSSAIFFKNINVNKLHIEDNIIDGRYYYGINLFEVDTNSILKNIYIRNNTINNLVNIGIKLCKLNDVVIEGNRLFNSNNNIIIYNCSKILLVKNILKTTNNSINVKNASNLNISENSIYFNTNTDLNKIICYDTISDSTIFNNILMGFAHFIDNYNWL